MSANEETRRDHGHIWKQVDHHEVACIHCGASPHESAGRRICAKVVADDARVWPPPKPDITHILETFS